MNKEYFHIPVYDVEMNERIPHLVKTDIIRYSEKIFAHPEALEAFCRSALRLDVKNEEHIYMLMCSACGEVIGVTELSHGSKTESIIDMRSFAVRLLLSGAVSVLVVHNHPSGDTTPSGPDDATCERMLKVANLIGVKLQEFMIIGSDCYSYKAEDRILGRKEEETE